MGCIGFSSFVYNVLFWEWGKMMADDDVDTLLLGSLIGVNEGIVVSEQHINAPFQKSSELSGLHYFHYRRHHV